MANCVLLREDDRDLIQLVHELLEDQDYTVVDVVNLEDLLVEATRRGPCVALIDGTHPAGFDLWWLGPVLSKLGVPPIAFTAHASAQEQFEQDAHGYAGVQTKPFDADAFIDLVNSICWEHQQQVASQRLPGLSGALFPGLAPPA